MDKTKNAWINFKLLMLITAAITYSSSRLMAQNYYNKVSVDTTAGTIKEAVPQDRNLIVYYPMKDKKIRAIGIYAVDNDGMPKQKLSRREYRIYVIKYLYLQKYQKTSLFNLKLFLSNNLLFSGSKLGELKKNNPRSNFEFFPVSDYRYNKKGDSLILYSPPLDPNRQYRYAIFTQKGDKETDKLYDIAKTIINDRDLDKAKTAFEGYYKFNPNSPYNIPFDTFQQIVEKNCDVRAAFNDYKTQRCKLDNYTYSSISTLRDEDCLKSIFNATLSNCKDCGLKYKGLIDSIPLFNKAILNLRSADIDNLNKGLLPLTGNSYDRLVKEEDVDSRLKNLQSSILVLRQIQRVSELIQIEQKSTTLCSCAITQVCNNIRMLQSNETAMKDLIIKREAFRDALIKTNGAIFTDVSMPGVGTTSFDFKTRNRNIINACFGLVTYGAVFDKNNFSEFGRFYDIAPFVGINVNLRAIDKNLPLKYVPNKTIWHRSAFFLGLSLNSVKDNTTREDFFGKSNLSLLLGGSYRLTNGIRINYGSLLFKRYNINPLYNRKTITAAPFVGLNLDLDLRELMGDFSSIFKP